MTIGHRPGKHVADIFKLLIDPIMQRRRINVDPDLTKSRTKAQKVQIAVRLISTEKLSEKQE